ncbi:hypothetical protein KDA_74970 [Dictyobacter alpinus]|uniref:Uncharacterized protein n=1 Tax=Dictyobacter alpinus TaxID=2014873 RepID=A0A402BKW7_9CHLR|nr:hypothetical protein [Dictyobacter alpinus]GCE32013.1 hypothetical protein KDA_74970 [Dictyobacter alpinus]
MEESITPKAGLEMAAQLFDLARRDPGELSEMLLTDDVAQQVLQEGLTLYIQEAKSQIESKTDSELLSPSVHATYSIDGSEQETVDVTRWFAASDDDDLLGLHEEAYGGDAISESIIAFMAFFDADVERLYFIASDPQVVCQVNQEEAQAWMTFHRPHLLREDGDA